MPEPASGLGSSVADDSTMRIRPSTDAFNGPACNVRINRSREGCLSIDAICRGGEHRKSVASVDKKPVCRDGVTVCGFQQRTCSDGDVSHTLLWRRRQVVADGKAGALT